jgi:hypothetical protein
VIEKYKDGLICTGVGPRTTEVIYTCGRDYLKVTSVTEVRICKYSYRVESRHLCADPPPMLVENPLDKVVCGPKKFYRAK